MEERFHPDNEGYFAVDLCGSQENTPGADFTGCVRLLLTDYLDYLNENYTSDKTKLKKTEEKERNEIVIEVFQAK